MAMKLGLCTMIYLDYLTLEQAIQRIAKAGFEGVGTANPLFFIQYEPIPIDSVWRPQGDSNPCYRRERAVS